ncbi:hypothetical protein [Lachnoclostridium phytofermentans]|uniref:Uncharacterized protein n=1 Tax=Lachnoclostridium phytofermentans (strain ATCC 700394 / DSM 18823 / ISDg) TaxID=357809 RepID=A9KK13_LACP7|nr:hypothetical protein [Lachnoclostridium phytofermentans]ABX42585.1 hypothetical protein Cphy_2219 [Lachnoclostridium phytofermentans ISDg]
MQAMLGYGDDTDEVRSFQETSLKGFERILEISSLNEITKYNDNSKKKYNYPYIESDEYYPDSYTLAMLGVGQNVNIIKESVANIEDALDADGVLRTYFELPKYRRYLSNNIEYPTAYVDVKLELDYKRKYALECDLTFWAMQFLSLVEKRSE